MPSLHSPSSVSTVVLTPSSSPGLATTGGSPSRRSSSGAPLFPETNRSHPSVQRGVDSSRHASVHRSLENLHDSWRERRSRRSRSPPRGRSSTRSRGYQRGHRSRQRLSRSRSPRRRQHSRGSRSPRRRQHSSRSRSPRRRQHSRCSRSPRRGHYSSRSRSSRSGRGSRQSRSPTSDLQTTKAVSIPTQNALSVETPSATLSASKVSVVHYRRTVVHVAGHAFTRYNRAESRTSYRCSAYRSAKCKAKLHFNHKENEYTFHGEHVCKHGRRDRLPPGLDVTEDMKEAVDAMSLTRMDLTAERVWKQIRADFYPDTLMLVQYGLTREQVIQRVHRTRRSHFGADLHGVVEVPPLSLVPGTNLPFFQFYRSYMNGTTLERLVGWARPALIRLLKYKKTTLFIDGTFRCVPHPFYQCVVMMVFDNATDLFVPVFFTLCTAKTQDTYWHLMEAVNVAADDKIEPSVVVCNFEEGLQAAAQVQFAGVDIVGCYFHFKQACRRKMKALGIPEVETRIAMTKGCMDMLTVIAHDKIEGPGICYVQAKIRSMCADENVAYTELLWDLFWSYFRKTWLKTYKPSVWNVHNVDAALVSRTNNPLERFNREINAALTAPHPSLPAFVSIIQVLSQRYVNRIDDMAKCRSKKRRRPQVEPLNLPLPVDLELVSMKSK